MRLAPPSAPGLVPRQWRRLWMLQLQFAVAEDPGPQRRRGKARPWSDLGGEKLHSRSKAPSGSTPTEIPGNLLPFIILFFLFFPVGDLYL